MLESHVIQIVEHETALKMNTAARDVGQTLNLTLTMMEDEHVVMELIGSMWIQSAAQPLLIAVPCAMIHV